MNHHQSLRGVTMNIAGLEPSREAPPDWTNQDALEYLRQEILRNDPDIIALQECPSATWVKDLQHSFLSDYFYPLSPDLYQETKASSYQTTPSHAGLVALWVRRRRKADNEGKTDQEPRDPPFKVTAVKVVHDQPAVALELEISMVGDQKQHHQALRIWFASMHLEPFEQGSFGRQDQLTDLVEQAQESGQQPCLTILAGDTNMREAEDEVAEQTIGLTDAWKKAGANPKTRFSWNTEPQEGNIQNLYYGSNTRPYKQRYDRIYYKLQNAPGIQVSVPSFELIANKPIGSSTTHFLSDHFGIAAEIQIQFTTDG